MITRGTTIVHTFTVPFKESEVDKLYITYSQNGAVIAEKSGSELVWDDEAGTVSAFLTQSDTLGFTAQTTSALYRSALALIQLRVLMKDGSALASKAISEAVEDVLKSGVIS